MSTLRAAGHVNTSIAVPAYSMTMRMLSVRFGGLGEITKNPRRGAGAFEIRCLHLPSATRPRKNPYKGSCLLPVFHLHAIVSNATCYIFISLTVNLSVFISDITCYVYPRRKTRRATRKGRSTTPSTYPSAGTGSRFPTGYTSCTGSGSSSSARSAATSSTRVEGACGVGVFVA